MEFWQFNTSNQRCHFVVDIPLYLYAANIDIIRTLTETKIKLKKNNPCSKEITKQKITLKLKISFEDVCEIIENIAYKQADLSKHNTQFQASP